MGNLYTTSECSTNSQSWVMTNARFFHHPRPIGGASDMGVSDLAGLGPRPLAEDDLTCKQET